RKHKATSDDRRSNIPSELMDQIISDYRDLGDLRRDIDGAFHGSIVEYTRLWIIDRIDLNRDGVADFIIYPPVDPFCGTHSGMVLIYQRTSVAYRNLIDRNQDYEPRFSIGHSGPV